MKYIRLFNEAYFLTVRNFGLWLFGLFVLGSSNLTFFILEQVSPTGALKPLGAWEYFQGLLRTPTLGTLLLFLGLLVVSLLGLFLTNWSRVMLILSVNSLLLKKVPSYKENAKTSFVSLFRVLKISFLTTGVMVMAGCVLLAPPLFLSQHYYGNILFFLGAAIFFPLAFTLSCLNIFSSLFAVLFKTRTGASINLGTDFFIVNWGPVLGLTMVLAAIYSAGFFAGAVLVYLLKLILAVLQESLLWLVPFSSHFLENAVAILGGIIFWWWLAGLNVFSNTVLILWFLETVTPVKTEAKEAAKMLVSPAAP